MIKRKRFKFQNQEGHTLSGQLVLPVSQRPHNFALFAHCFTCSKNLRAVREISRGLSTHGFGVFIFDFTGLGDSEGTFAETNLSSNVADLLSAANFLKENFKAPSIMVGHSFGGAAILQASFSLSSVKAVATIASPFDPEHVQHLFAERKEEILAQGKAKVNIGGRPFTIQKQFLDDIEGKSVAHKLHQMQKAFLVMHAPQDDIVSIENARLLYEYAIHPKSFISLDGADHLLRNKYDARYAGKVIASWASRYVPMPRDISIRSDQDVVVELDATDGFTTDIQAGPHRFLSDEPEESGGEELGPTPYEFLSAGLGSCTAMTLQMYAKRKKWPLVSVRVHVEHEKTHKEDSKANSKLDRFIRHIECIGPLSKEQRTRLLDIANKCPVHKTLSQQAEIRTILVGEEG